MPIYCYKCEFCEAEVEVTQKVNDPAPACPNLDLEEEDSVFDKPHNMKRQIASTSFILKGANWYRDGYSSSKK